jgi:Na+/phosphate symporter
VLLMEMEQLTDFTPTISTPVFCSCVPKTIKPLIMIKLPTINFKAFKVAILSVAAVALFLFINVPVAHAISLPSGAEVQTNFEQAQEQFEQFVEQSQKTLNKQIKEAQKVLKNLPDNIEESTAEFDAAHRKAVLADLEAAQQKLEETAKAYEQYAQQADELEQEMLQSAKQSRAEMRAGARQKVEDAKESLQLTSDALNVLVDDMKKAISDTSTFSKVRLNQHTQALQQALDTSNQALKTLFQ